jgi:hypothetical protein
MFLCKLLPQSPQVPMLISFMIRFGGGAGGASGLGYLSAIPHVSPESNSMQVWRIKSFFGFL